MGFKPLSILKVTGLLLAVVFAVSACSSSATSSSDAKLKPISDTRTSLSQLPSEINIPIKGKITRTGEVYLLRGLANVFSRGMDTMGAKMIRAGLDARVYNHSVWRSLADNIIARNKRKQVSYPIIIMGHSLGGNASAQMAKYLGDNNIKVQYVVAFDPTVTTYVGKNINRVINFYLPNDSNSNVVKRSPGFKGALKNINVRGVRGVTHTTIEKDSNFHNQVINRTLSYTKKRRK
jgi:HAMP domain-containing protein